MGDDFEKAVLISLNYPGTVDPQLKVWGDSSADRGLSQGWQGPIAPPDCSHREAPAP